jgi:pimeloyl-ACP methyl ester carboxylesterase
MDEHHVRLPSGLRIHYLTAGDPARPPVVLLHGYPLDARLWQGVIPALAQDHWVVAPDLPGHGDSDKPPDAAYDLAFFLDFAVRFMAALGLERTDVVGHDLGGMVALGLAARHPELVRRLVIMDTAPFSEWPVRMRVMLGVIRQRWGARLFLWRPYFRTMLRWFGFVDRRVFGPELAESFRDPWVASRESRAALSRVVSAPPAEITPTRPDLGNIAAPSLVLWADRDRFFPVKLARDLAAVLPRAQLTVIPRAGHFSPLEKPNEVAELIGKFIAKDDHESF